MVGTDEFLPESIEDELISIHFEYRGDERNDHIDALCKRHAKHAEAIGIRAAALERGDRLLGDMRDGLRDLAKAQRVGPFEIVRVLGEGGFGTVYLAQQHDPVQRLVALKVLQSGRTDARSRQRFEDERQALARLQHASIAQVYDAGVTDDYMPYFAMEFVDGIPVTAWCEQHATSTDERLELFLKVCRAIHHAHQCEIVHRDVKPTNVLVRDEDGAPLPKVIDFGIAKLMATNEPDRDVTIQGALIGTPGYMSPEQAAGEPVDARTDVYSLGVLLCELLTGKQPLARERLASASLGAMARILENESPRRPSTLLTKEQHLGDRALVARLREDLDWIVLRAVATDRNERYTSVAALADDVERHLRGDAVQARQQARAYLVRKFIKRHRVAAAVAALLLLSLVAAVASLSWGINVAEDARVQAERERDHARARERASRMAVAQMAMASGDVQTALTNLAAIAPEDRGFEWRYLAAQSDTSERRFEIGNDCLDVLWLDDEHVAMFPMFAAPRIWNVQSGETERRIEWQGVLRRIAHDEASGQAILAGDSGTAVIDLATGAQVRSLGRRPGEVRALIWTPDRETAIFGGGGRWIEAVRVADGTRSHSWRTQHEPTSLCVLDEQRLIVGCADGTIQVLSRSDGSVQRSFDGHSDIVTDLLVDEARGTLFSSSFDGTVRAWRLQDGETQAVMRTKSRMWRLRLSTDGERIYGCGGFAESVLAAWNTRTFELSGRYHGHELGVLKFDLSPDGTRLASASRDGTMRIWSAQPPRNSVRLPAGFDARVLSCDRSGNRFAAASLDGLVTVWNADDLTVALQLETDEPWTGSALSDDTIYTASTRLCAFSLTDGTLLREGKTNGRRIENMLVDPGQRWIAGGFGKRVLIWRCSDLALLYELQLPVAAARMAWDPEAAAFAVSGTGSTVRWIDPENGRVVREQQVGDGKQEIGSLAIRQDVLATGSGRLLSIRVGDRERLRIDTSHKVAAISPDGKLLVTGGEDQKVRLWDIETGDQLLVFSDLDYPVGGIHFVDHGNRIVALSHRWETPTAIHVFSAPATVSRGR